MRNIKDSLLNQIEEIEKESLMLGGDFNARIGEKGNMIRPEEQDQQKEI